MEEVLAILKRIVTGIHANEVDGLLEDIDKLLSPKAGPVPTTDPTSVPVASATSPYESVVTPEA
jgi:hypothetical protein